MGSLWQAPAALIVLITWLTATPVSLSEISRRETLRRQATPRSTTALTNDDLPLWAPAVVSRPETPPVADADSSADVDATIDPAGLPAGADGELASTEARTGEVQDRGAQCPIRVAVVGGQRRERIDRERGLGDETSPVAIDEIDAASPRRLEELLPKRLFRLESLGHDLLVGPR